jgi:hypothetical protein
MTVNVQIDYKNKTPIITVGKYRNIELVQWDSRFVYKIGKDYYLKLDKNPKWFNGNDGSSILDHTLEELKNWEKYKNTYIKDYLCPPLLHGLDKYKNTWVLQPACKTKARNRNKYKDSKMLSKIAYEMELCDVVSGDWGYCQWGYYLRFPVLFDYGL